MAESATPAVVMFHGGFVDGSGWEPWAKGPVVLVGHSYGGVVITEAGNDPKVAALFYIAAFAPDKGESVAALIKDPQPARRSRRYSHPQDGFPFLDRAKFAASFAADETKPKRLVQRVAFRADELDDFRVEIGSTSVPGQSRTTSMNSKPGPAPCARASSPSSPLRWT